MSSASSQPWFSLKLCNQGTPISGWDTSEFYLKRWSYYDHIMHELPTLDQHQLWIHYLLLRLYIYILLLRLQLCDLQSEGGAHTLELMQLQPSHLHRSHGLGLLQKQPFWRLLRLFRALENLVVLGVSRTPGGNNCKSKGTFELFLREVSNLECNTSTNLWFVQRGNLREKRQKYWQAKGSIA